MNVTNNTPSVKILSLDQTANKIHDATIPVHAHDLLLLSPEEIVRWTALCDRDISLCSSVKEINIDSKKRLAPKLAFPLGLWIEAVKKEFGGIAKMMLTGEAVAHIAACQSKFKITLLLNINETQKKQVDSFTHAWIAGLLQKAGLHQSDISEALVTGYLKSDPAGNKISFGTQLDCVLIDCAASASQELTEVQGWAIDLTSYHPVWIKPYTTKNCPLELEKAYKLFKGKSLNLENFRPSVESFYLAVKALTSGFAYFDQEQHLRTFINKAFASFPLNEQPLLLSSLHSFLDNAYGGDEAGKEIWFLNALQWIELLEDAKQRTGLLSALAKSWQIKRPYQLSFISQAIALYPDLTGHLLNWMKGLYVLESSQAHSAVNVFPRLDQGPRLLPAIGICYNGMWNYIALFGNGALNLSFLESWKQLHAVLEPSRHPIIENIHIDLGTSKVAFSLTHRNTVIDCIAKAYLSGSLGALTAQAHIAVLPMLEYLEKEGSVPGGNYAKQWRKKFQKKTLPSLPKKYSFAQMKEEFMKGEESLKFTVALERISKPQECSSESDYFDFLDLIGATIEGPYYIYRTFVLQGRKDINLYIKALAFYLNISDERTQPVQTSKKPLSKKLLTDIKEDLKSGFLTDDKHSVDIRLFAIDELLNLIVGLISDLDSACAELLVKPLVFFMSNAPDGVAIAIAWKLKKFTKLKIEEIAHQAFVAGGRINHELFLFFLSEQKLPSVKFYALFEEDLKSGYIDKLSLEHRILTIKCLEILKNKYQAKGEETRSYKELNKKALSRPEDKQKAVTYIELLSLLKKAKTWGLHDFEADIREGILTNAAACLDEKKALLEAAIDFLTSWFFYSKHKPGLLSDHSLDNLCVVIAMHIPKELSGLHISIESLINTANTFPALQPIAQALFRNMPAKKLSLYNAILDIPSLSTDCSQIELDLASGFLMDQAYPLQSRVEAACGVFKHIQKYDFSRWTLSLVTIYKNSQILFGSLINMINENLHIPQNRPLLKKLFSQFEGKGSPTLAITISNFYLSAEGAFKDKPYFEMMKKEVLFIVKAHMSGYFETLQAAVITNDQWIVGAIAHQLSHIIFLHKVCKALDQPQHAQRCFNYLEKVLHHTPVTVLFSDKILELINILDSNPTFFKKHKIESAFFPILHPRLALQSLFVIFFYIPITNYSNEQAKHLHAIAKYFTIANTHNQPEDKTLLNFINMLIILLERTIPVSMDYLNTASDLKEFTMYISAMRENNLQILATAIPHLSTFLKPHQATKISESPQTQETPQHFRTCSILLEYFTLFEVSLQTYLVYLATYDDQNIAVSKLQAEFKWPAFTNVFSSLQKLECSKSLKGYILDSDPSILLPVPLSILKQLQKSNCDHLLKSSVDKHYQEFILKQHSTLIKVFSIKRRITKK